MRKRVLQEGSVGLLILGGVGLLTGLTLWLQGTVWGKKTYSIVVEFPSVSGMQLGAAVRYRGVQVGRITEIQPATNGVDVTLEIAEPNLVIPRNVRIEANQSGFVGETSVDITPQQLLAESVQENDPRAQDCNSIEILCNGSRVDGNVGVSFEELLRSSQQLADVLSDPTFNNNVNSLFKQVETVTKQAGTALTGVSQLTKDLSGLTGRVQTELGTVSTTAASVSSAADQIRVSTAQLTDQFGSSGTQVTNQLNRTATQASQLFTNLDNLLTTNRSTVVTLLDNLNQTSNDLRVTVRGLQPIVGKVEQGKLLENLEQLSANAAAASANLRDLTTVANNPITLLVLQQTLDSARATFQNAQKITSDLDELTGDPAFRSNLRNLVNGLGNLVSSTEQLQQMAIAQPPAALSDLKFSQSVQSQPILNPLNPDTIYLGGDLVETAWRPDSVKVVFERNKDWFELLPTPPNEEVPGKTDSQQPSLAP